MKYIIILSAAIMLSVTGYSQSLYSLNYNVSFSSGETAKFIQNTSFRGFTFEGRGFISEQVSIGGLFNWSTFYEKLAGAEYTRGTATVTGNQYRYINAFPMLFQAHYYLQDDEYEPRVYMGGGVGPYIINQRVNIGVWTANEDNWHFGISPEVGLLFPVSMTTSFNLSVRYHYVFKAKNTVDHSWFGLTAGFAWGD